MKSTLRRLILLTLAWALQALPGNAQNTDQPEVSVRFTTIGWNDETPDVFYKQNGKLAKMEVMPFLRSKTHTYSGPSKMPLYSAGQTDKPAGFVDFPVGPKRFTVLLGGANGSFQTRVIADDAAGFPLGTARILNLLNTRMQIRCNQKDIITIPAGKHQIAKPRSDDQLVAEAAIDRNGKWMHINDDFIETAPDAQTSVFYFESDAKYFKSVDGVARAIQLLVLQERPNQEQEPAQLQSEVSSEPPPATNPPRDTTP